MLFRSPKPQTPNPKPQTPNPKPQTPGVDDDIVIMELRLKEAVQKKPASSDQKNNLREPMPGELDILISMRFTINNNDIGEITVQLYSDVEVAPLTHNFLCLALAKKYDNSTIFRMKKGYYMQAGDTQFNCGIGGLSSSGGKIYDYPSAKAFSRPYRIAMMNTGPHSTASQFFITFDSCPWLDGWFGAFGEVVDGRPYMTLQVSM